MVWWFWRSKRENVASKSTASQLTSTPPQHTSTLLQKKIAKLSSKENSGVSTLGDPTAIKNEYFAMKHLLTSLKDRNYKLKCKLVYIRLERASSLSRVFAIHFGKLIGANLYGLLHPCILIGNTLIHWVSDSLVHFTDFTSKQPFIAVDIGEIDISNTLEAIKLDDVCEVISDYNKNKEYSEVKCNCHHFTRDIQKALGMQVDIPGQMGEFLKQLVTQSNPVKKFKSPFAPFEEVEFTSHKQLDLFVKNLVDQYPEFKTDEQYKYDWLLLKSFDRGFYMGKYNEERKSPVERNSELLYSCLPAQHCPFEDPYNATLYVTAEQEEL